MKKVVDIDSGTFYGMLETCNDEMYFENLDIMGLTYIEEDESTIYVERDFEN